MLERWTHEELAACIDTVREVVTRNLARLQRDDDRAGVSRACCGERVGHATVTLAQVRARRSGGGAAGGGLERVSDGRLGAETVAAIRAFEQDQGLTPKGRISAEVLGRLQNSATRQKAAEAN
mgnify:CR=1 FL=1